MTGDPTLLMLAGGGTGLVHRTALLDASTAKKADFSDHDSGNDGPNAADELLARDGGRV
jgi:hypothetical protein